ncbi:MAG TPA: FtsX-like permease family protein [Candidatus Anoxymicrobiaceae bacterium]
MRLGSLALKNLKRHRVRTILTIAGIAISALTLFIILAFNNGYDKALKEDMTASGVHLYVSMEGCPLQAATLILHGGEIPSYLDQVMLPDIQSMDEVSVAGGYLISTIISNGRADFFYGITKDVLKLKPYWKINGSYFKNDDSIILGADVAKDTGKKAGDTITIEALKKTFNVTGVLAKNGKEDDGFYFMPVTTQQELFKKQGKLTAIGIQLKDISQLESVKTQLEKRGAYVVPQQDISDLVTQLVGGTKAILFGILAVVLVVAGLGVFNTVLMATFERKEEFGYLRAVGARRADVFSLIILETLWLCAVGLTVGLAAGYAFSFVIDGWIRRFLPYSPPGTLVKPDLLSVLVAVGVVVVLGLVAGIYPGYKASRVSPMEAIRNE